MTGEISRLAEELKRDRQAWENCDWQTRYVFTQIYAVSEMVEKWWQSTVAQEENLLSRALSADAVEKEHRAASMDSIKDSRKAFLEGHMKNTAKHLNSLAKSVGMNHDKNIVNHEREQLDAEYGQVEDEWEARRRELILAREEITRREMDR